MYTNLTDTLVFTKNIIELDTNLFDTLLINWLELSKGKNYRPFIVAAYFLNLKPPRNGLIKTTGNDGAEWINTKELIKAHLLTQRTLDCNDILIERCWTVDYVYKIITGQSLPEVDTSQPNFYIV